MNSIKSQFTGGNTGAGDFLLGSLSLIGEDTRRGFSPSAQTTITNMKGYVEANPDKTNAERFNTYVAKLAGASEQKPAIARPVKPATGMMG